ncbi:MAG: F0F1 ATP synthase subunit B' [Pseudomonadota bacterium]
MPQFDPSSFASQIFWLVIVFGILYLLLKTLAIPKISDVVDARARRIEDDLDQAARLKTEAETVLAAYEKALADAHKEARSILQEAQSSLSKTAAEREKAFAETMRTKTAEAEERIVAARQAAVDTAREVAAATVQSVTEKVGGISVDEAAAAKAVEAALKERG